MPFAWLHLGEPSESSCRAAALLPLFSCRLRRFLPGAAGRQIVVTLYGFVRSQVHEPTMQHMLIMPNMPNMQNMHTCQTCLLKSERQAGSAQASSEPAQAKPWTVAPEFEPMVARGLCDKFPIEQFSPETTFSVFFSAAIVFLVILGRCSEQRTSVGDDSRYVAWCFSFWFSVQI